MSWTLPPLLKRKTFPNKNNFHYPQSLWDVKSPPKNLSLIILMAPKKTYQSSVSVYIVRQTLTFQQLKKSSRIHYNTKQSHRKTTPCCLQVTIAKKMLNKSRNLVFFSLIISATLSAYENTSYPYVCLSNPQG